MTETSGFMDPGTYDAAQFARAVRTIIKDGYQNGYLNELAVAAATPNAMSVVVATGGAWVQGCWYTSDAANTLVIDTAHATLDRIDRIILRKTATTSIQAVVLKGTAAASPSAPALTQTVDGTYEISLAQVLVTHAVTSIAGTGTTLITDERNAAYSAMGDVTITSAGTVDVGTHLISSVTDPVGDQDADTKHARDHAITTAIAAINTSDLYGDGSDGHIHISSDTGSYSGTYQATTFVVDAGKTLTLTGNTIIMANESITINGSIVGTGASPCTGGIGSTSDGAGGAAAGNALFKQNAGAGGMYGAGTGAAQTSINAGYPTYGAVLTAAQKKGFHSAMYIMGVIVGGGNFGSSSGGGGNANSALCHGGNGGKGGAILVLMAPTITLAATTGFITLNGANGVAATSDTSVGAGGGGGGGGGTLILVGKTITMSGTVAYAGGSGGAGSYNKAAYGAADGAAGSAGETITFSI